MNTYDVRQAIQTLLPHFTNQTSLYMELYRGNIHNAIIFAIIVKVYKTVCELNSIRSPWWYQLEVLEKIAEFGSGASSRSSAQDGSSNETSVRGAESEENGGAGVFKAPQAYELKICKHDTVSYPPLLVL